MNLWLQVRWRWYRALAVICKALDMEAAGELFLARALLLYVGTKEHREKTKDVKRRLSRRDYKGFRKD